MISPNTKFNKAFVFLFLFLFNAVKAQEVKPDYLESGWMKVSIKAQNAHYHAQKKLRTLAGAGLDPSMVADDIKQIQELVRNLEKEKILEKRNVTLLSPNKLREKNGFEMLLKFVEHISKDYGYYTSLELMDMGLTMQTKMLPPDRPVVLVVHLPPHRLNEFIAYVKEHGLVE